MALKALWSQPSNQPPSCGPEMRLFAAILIMRVLSVFSFNFICSRQTIRHTVQL